MQSNTAAATAGLARWTSLRRTRARLRELEHEQAVERERARIARDIHDDLGARLSHLALMADSGAGKNGLAQTARDTIQAMDELVWAVNARNDTVPAFAASSAQSGYSTPGAKIQTFVDPNAHSSASLPFTGLDVIAIVAVGAMLLAVGFGIRRLARTTAS